MKGMKVYRVLIYEGDEEAIKKNLRKRWVTTLRTNADGYTIREELLTRVDSLGLFPPPTPEPEEEWLE